MNEQGPLPIADDDLVACVSCGLCLPHCPTYRVTGLEQASPRGRITAMRAVQAGAPMDQSFGRMMDECVQCRGCEAACPSGVPFGRMMEGAREALVETGAPRGGSGARRLAVDVATRTLLPRHRLLERGTRLAAHVPGAGRLAAAAGLPAPAADALQQPLVGDPDPDVWLFTGCVMDVLQRDVHRDALRVLRATGTRVGLPEGGADCCGALATHSGHVEDARRLARRVIAALPGDAPVVVDSAGCGAALLEYGRLLGTREAAAFATRVQDISTFLASRMPLPVRATGTRVVVQDPCHLRHVQKAHGAVRTVLAAAYELAEPDDDGLCCGAGGAYALLQPEMAGAIRDRKVTALQAAGGDGPLVVASANPGCALHLQAAGLDVRHPVSLLAAALIDPSEEDR